MLSIAIDGPAGAGKSSIAKEIAKRFDIAHVDTGAMYRAIALSVINSGISSSDESGVESILSDVEISHIYSGKGYRIFLCGDDVTEKLRTDEVSRVASVVSGYPAVREKLLVLQREAAKAMSVVMDGRDIGTVVLPDASVKIFLTASEDARAKRRWLENIEKGYDESYEKVLADVVERDKKDTTRAIAPLVPADDAIIIDTTSLDFNRSVEAVCMCIDKYLSYKK